MAKHNELGLHGERIACDYILQKGYRILERNYRYKKSEIDIIATISDCLVFIEVKSRKNIVFSSAESAINQRKIDKLHEGALHYLESNDEYPNVRFDIIAVIIGEQQPEINHIENAFWN